MSCLCLRRQDICTDLIAEGLSVQAVDIEGNMPIHHALQQGQPDVSGRLSLSLCISYRRQLRRRQKQQQRTAAVVLYSATRSPMLPPV